MAHPVAAYAGAGHLDPAPLADDALEPDPLVLAAVALPVLGRTEDSLVEEPVLFGAEGTIVDGLGLGDFAPRPLPDLIGGGEADGDLLQFVYVYVALESLHALYTSSSEGTGWLLQIARRFVAAEVYAQSPGGLVPIPAVLILGRGLGVVDRLDREPQRLHLFEEHLEARGHARLGNVLALDDRLVALDPTDPVVALYGQELLQGV